MMINLLLAIPIIGAIIVGIIPNEKGSNNARNVALATGILTLIISGIIAADFNPKQPGLQQQLSVEWLPFLGLNYTVGIDGLSLPLILLNCLLVTLSFLNGELEGKRLSKPKLYFILVLLLTACVNGALIAQNLLLFFILYEVKLVPTYLLISTWGRDKSGYAGIKYLLYTAFSGIFVLTAFLALYFLNGSSSFDIDKINTAILPESKQIILLASIVIGFAIKIPIFPLHTWLPPAYTESATPVSMLLGGIVSKLGTYGLIRFGLQLFPQIWQEISPYLAIIAVVSAIYGSLVAVSQTDIKKMVAYASLAHINFVVLATAAATQLAITGAIVQMIAHGLIVALLFHLVGIIEEKTGSREMSDLQGLMNPYRGFPFVGGLMITAVMASAGIPGMIGFVGEFICFQGSFTVFPIYTLLCLIATGLTAVYFVILINRVFFGRLDNYKGYYPSVKGFERIPAIILAVMIIFFGIQPSLLTNFSLVTSQMIAQKAQYNSRVL
ncbi:MAG: NADH-quinone oxidoreductase subunit M [Geminocystis sp.]|nr:NADH-quinone oxidoreductase subunit M [Geminocystis sp.]MCS7147554.1 NADH-quinone oxidoreductase subunit M [Geminocystis sp.]MCX8077957.1 NADH-quinone oxidoreductase subunit M [Geminocystis sp.]MDW8115247.1 NADH-quinone oxidoreductase subunit M [Geminocystis sp.]MDW8464517.1 NADH-quinone oxidoreductase subunit M [Geminocystis sp.]